MGKCHQAYKLSLIPKTHMMEEESHFHRLASNFHLQTMAHVHTLKE